MDPYKVLGVSPSATDEEIKQAYRSLAKKYHPDRYKGHDLEDLANERLKEINQAYDTIVKERKARAQGGDYGYGSSSYSDSSSYSGSSYGGSTEFADVRSAMQMGDVTRADSMLDSMGNRNAEWHYLKGTVLLRKGWYDGARQHFATAVNMDPGNPEYARAYNTLNQNASGYGQTFYGGQGYGGSNDACTLCSGLCCAEICCDSMRCC
jgi:molecular chaperone DnaJ